MLRLIQFHLLISRHLNSSDRLVYLTAMFFFYFPIIFMITIILLKLLDSSTLMSLPAIYAAPPLSWTFFETVPGWAYIALMSVGLSLHFNGLATIPSRSRSSSQNRYLYYWQNGRSIVLGLWRHFKKYPEIKTLLIYISLFVGIVYLYNSI
jgi:hypothetical protein